MLPKFAIGLLKNFGIYYSLRDWWHDLERRKKDRRQIRLWVAASCPAPPPEGIKHANLRKIADEYSLPNLVETGTYYGETPFALRKVFQEIHSIELSPSLYGLARRRLQHCSNIRLYCGDSSQILPDIVRGLTQPTLFWLDGHYCAGPSARGASDTPIVNELEVVLAQPAGENVLLIDDARFFTGQADYPSIEWIRTLIERHRPHAKVTLESDAIFIYPV